ncbi:hypothetical protein OnM2_033110 [Erysiphe neolycopersici]|uniref:Uncharacterized protein n=1 Tax=Erysiphe neolycopersici TaxID=212602 RepID=A0A420HY95_9PEZI|nr:hypothetical protein OnM2_033110 [Erysiphe neolycopersici]
MSQKEFQNDMKSKMNSRFEHVEEQLKKSGSNMDEIMSQLKNITSVLGELKTSENKGKGNETAEAVTAPGQSLFIPPKAPTFFKPLPDNFKFTEASNS